MRPPFVKQTGEGIRESLGGQQDPAGYNKITIENEMEMALTAFFRAQQTRVRAELEPRIPEDRKAVQLPLPFWHGEELNLLNILLPFLQRAAEGGVAVQRAIVESMGIGVDWTAALTEAATWARETAGRLVTSITETTRNRIAGQVANWVETPGRTLPDLWRSLMDDHAFSRARAKLIAATEVTRAYAEGEMAAASRLEKEGWFKYEKEWQTAMDDRVCPICEPLQGTRVESVSGQFDTAAGSIQGPPAHPGCRCWINTIPSVG